MGFFDKIAAAIAFSPLIASASPFAAIATPSPIETTPTTPHADAISTSPDLNDHHVTYSAEAEKELLEQFKKEHRGIELIQMSREEYPDLYKAVDQAQEKVKHTANIHKLIPAPTLYMANGYFIDNDWKMEYQLTQNFDPKDSDSTYNTKGFASVIFIKEEVLTKYREKVTESIQSAIIEQNTRWNPASKKVDKLTFLEEDQKLAVEIQEVAKKQGYIEIHREQYPELFARVDEVFKRTKEKAQALGIENIPPYPKLYLNPLDQKDYAEAVPRNTFDDDGRIVASASAIKFTAGFLKNSPEQQQGVIAHEAGHLASFANPNQNKLVNMPSKREIDEAINAELNGIYLAVPPDSCTSYLKPTRRTSSSGFFHPKIKTPPVSQVEEMNADHTASVLFPEDATIRVERYETKSKNSIANEVAIAKSDSIPVEKVADDFLYKRLEATHPPNNLRAELIARDAGIIRPDPTPIVTSSKNGRCR